MFYSCIRTPFRIVRSALFSDLNPRAHVLVRLWHRDDRHFHKESFGDNDGNTGENEDQLKLDVSNTFPPVP
jgi:hypothetical protein